jgi:RNA polymerase sigma-70 factor (ECF subfamily)
LRRYALALLRDPQDADDLVHDCLVRALDRLHTKREDGDVRAWLFSILYHLFVSQKRRAAARPDGAALDGVDAPSVGAAGAPDARLRWRELSDALNKLPEEQRAVILLISVEDFSYAEAARALGIPVGTVMSRLSRARERLRVLTDDSAHRADARVCLRRVK